MLTRRPVFRRAVVRCGACGSVLTWDISPLAYVQHVWGKAQHEPAHEVKCVCGSALEITVGQLARAA